MNSRNNPSPPTPMFLSSMENFLVKTFTRNTILFLCKPTKHTPRFPWSYLVLFCGISGFRWGSWRHCYCHKQDKNCGFYSALCRHWPCRSDSYKQFKIKHLGICQTVHIVNVVCHCSFFCDHCCGYLDPRTSCQ